MSEAQILERLQSKLRAMGLAAGNGVIEGIGDDCAILRPRGAAEDLLFTTDQMHEGRHFFPAARPAEVGHQALARSLSDIAAMGGRPLFALVSLAVPARAAAWVDGFYRGFLRLAGRHGVVLAGGDLSTTERIGCDVMVCGAVARGRALLRSKARPGDRIYVSGPLGAAARALAAGRMRPAVPQLALGATLWPAGVRCAMDLSDGLSTDLARLCLASGVAAALETVPAARGARPEQALHGGEDYQLLFTARRPVRGALAIGSIVGGPPGAVTLDGRPVAPLGWDHFSPHDS